MTRCGAHRHGPAATRGPNLKLSIHAGSLARLRRDSDGAEGRFAPSWAGFTRECPPLHLRRLLVRGLRAHWAGMGAGPAPLWAAVEDAHRRWDELDEPGWDRFGLTVTSDRQWIWLDAPDGDRSWPLRPLP